jgi:hypothetical protein
MKLVGLMILVPLLALVVLTGARLSRKSLRGPSERDDRSSAIAPVMPPTAQSPDEAALLKIKREHSLGRYPFLVSSLCRDFLERYQHSPLRADVESILNETQQVIRESEARPVDPVPTRAPPSESEVTP